MTSLTANSRLPDAAGASPVKRKSRPPARSSAALTHFAMALLVLSAWYVGRLGWFEPGDRVDYWLGVAGGTIMLLVFLYPLRKYVRPMFSLGAVRWWLWAHLTFGLVGPWLILVHSQFRFGSLNAGVALSCMIVVVLSGIVGRFLYVHVHSGLNGEKTTLKELQVRAGFVERDARSKLHFAPKVEKHLLAFEEQVLKAPPGWGTYLAQVMILPFRQRHVERRCRQELDVVMTALAERRGWTAAELKRSRRHAERRVERYLNAVVRVAQFTAYERLFALWHVAHLPFVYMLVVTAIIHVIAVHAY